LRVRVLGVVVASLFVGALIFAQAPAKPPAPAVNEKGKFKIEQE